MAFIFIMLKGREVGNTNLQLAPENYLYHEKFGYSKPYSTNDISGIGFVKNVRINNVAGSSEPKIAVHPLNKNIYAVSANDFSIDESHARIFISTDGAVNWEPKQIPLSGVIKKSSYSDPWIGFDSEGNLYFIAVQFDLENNMREGIFISRSSDNGNTWEADLTFIDYNNKEKIKIDRPRMCIDKTSANKNNIYVVWTEIKGLNSFVMFSKSTDKGDTFTKPVTLESADVDYCSVITNSAGDLFVTYLKDENKISLIKSENAGESWNPVEYLASTEHAGVRSGGKYILKNRDGKGIRANTEPVTAVTKNDDLIITYSAAGSNADVSDIYFMKISKDMKEITAPIKINNDNSKSDQFLPSITVDESNNIFILYQDSRNDPDNMLTETYVSYSGDNGKTFHDEKISTKNFDPSQISVNNYFCDYNSCIAADDKLVGVWTDGRNENFDLYAGMFGINDLLKNIQR